MKPYSRSAHMPISDIDVQYLIILQALEDGVQPSEVAARELLELGIVEQAGAGWAMTLAARTRLQNLRSQLRDANAIEIELFSGDISEWLPSGEKPE